MEHLPPIESLTRIHGVTFIGLGHKARHGKNTAAEAIHYAFPELTKCFAYADALKAICRAQYGMTKKDGPLLQRVGTEIVRAEDPGAWVRTLYWTVDENPSPFVLVTDVRFPDEADFIHQMGGVLIKVSRLNDDGTFYVSPDRPATHSSETALDGYNGWDFHIQSRSVDQTREEALGIFEGVRATVGLRAQLDLSR